MNKASVQQLNDPDRALGLAAAYVAAHPPFGSFRADKLVGSIVGQIQRRHYAFAVRDKAVVGYIGWALCTPDVAEAWIGGGQAPRPEQYNQGDVVVQIIFIAEDPAALRQLVAHMRSLYKGKEYIGNRVMRENNFIKRGRL
ncbi:hypothetical protein [Microvirga soli]|uniref:hypothetical protein n=1 Tax=Microvirga soli TaxID=1854496 RepID=UPI00191FCCF2|nr:hypothetical protein [Microvirga soli]